MLGHFEYPLVFSVSLFTLVLEELTSQLYFSSLAATTTSVAKLLSLSKQLQASTMQSRFQVYCLAYFNDTVASTESRSALSCYIVFTLLLLLFPRPAYRDANIPVFYIF